MHSSTVPFSVAFIFGKRAAAQKSLAQLALRNSRFCCVSEFRGDVRRI